MLADFYQNPRFSHPEKSKCHVHRCDNVRSLIIMITMLSCRTEGLIGRFSAWLWLAVGAEKPPPFSVSCMRKDWVCNRACVQGIRRLWTRSSIPDGTKKLFLQRSWLALGLTCIYIQCVSRAFSLREKWPEPKTNQFSLRIAFIKNMWGVPAFPYVFMV